MSNSLEDIHSLLAGKITAGHELLLESGMFDEMGRALSPLGRTDLLLKDASIELANQKITVRGKTDLLNLTRLTTQLEITGSAPLRVGFRFELPPGWKFEKSFGNLPKTYKNVDGNEGLVSLQPSILNDFSFNEAAFIVQNSDNGTLSTGLNFSGVIEDPAALGYVKDLLGIARNSRLEGHVRLKADGPPDFHLTFVIVSPHLQLVPALQVKKVACQFRSAPPTEDEPDPRTCLELVGTFEIGSTDPVIVTATTPLYTGTTLFSFHAELEGSGLTISKGVNALVEFTGGTAADFKLPDALKLDQFRLKDFALAADPVAHSVRHIKFTVASDQPWTITNNLEITDLQFGWLILFPFNQVARTTSATVSGTLVFGQGADKVHFHVTASRHMGFTITGSLREGDPIRLAKLIEMALGSKPGGLPELNVDFLEIEAGTSGDFSFEGILKSDWTLPLRGDHALTLKQVSFSFSKTGQQKKGTLSSVLNIANTKLYVTAGVQESGQGVVFEGGTFGDDQQLDLAAVGEYLLGTFGVRLPASLPQVLVRQLKTKFNTATNDFSFDAVGSFQVHDKPVEITLNIVLTKSDGSYAGDFGGQITVGTSVFKLTFSKDSSAKVFVGTYHNTAGVAIPLKSFIEKISSEVAGLVPDELEVKLKDVLFGFRKNSEGNKFLFGVDFDTKISLSDLPVVGKEFPPDKAVSVENLRLLVTSAGLSKPEIAELNKVIPSGITKLPTGTSDAGGEVVATGLTISARLNMGGSTKELIMQVAKRSRRATAELAAPEALAASSSDNVKWFVLEKSFGPVYLDKLGVQYQDSTISFLLNAALSAAGLTLSLDGASIGSPLSEFKPEFSLSGLGIEYKNEAVEIGGAFMRTVKKGEPDSYDGAAVIKTKQFALSALGSYTTLENQPSLFIYAFLDYPLGGPAFFFVTGLAAGFGYNRRLIAPSVDKVAEFPLVKQATGREAAPSGVMKALESLRNDIPPSVGDIFLALGVRFNSFKLVDSFALLTFEFGNRFVVNLLGLSTAVVPPEAGANVTPLAKIQIAWKATYNPDEGCLGIDARLTPNSYILSKDCHLSGGYAFYSWFTGDHAGDFVQTLGGYHPDFEKTLPAHYPKVPRLAFDWRVNSSLTIQGDAYYALTGSALMAGGHLEVLFREGELRAWLKLGADFLIAWKPYHYDARVSVNVGASYTFDINLLFGHVRVTISVDVGADLHLWGPDFSGTAHIDISVISFTIAFGASASQKPAAIQKWSVFQESFLPPKNVCSISVQDGLIRKVDEAGKERWIINPKDFSLLVNSAIPFKHAFSKKNDNEDLVLAGANVGFGVRPMAVSPNDLNSTLRITVKRGTAAADGELKYEVIKKTVPKGLWEGVLNGDLTPDLDPEAFLHKVPSGIEIKPAAELGAGASATINLDVFKYSEAYYYQDEDPSKQYAFNWEPAGGFTLDKQDPEIRRKKIEAEVASKPALAALLRDMGVAVTVSMRGNIVAGDFMSAPQIGKL